MRRNGNAGSRNRVGPADSQLSVFHRYRRHAESGTGERGRHRHLLAGHGECVLISVPADRYIARNIRSRDADGFHFIARVRRQSQRHRRAGPGGQRRRLDSAAGGLLQRDGVAA